MNGNIVQLILKIIFLMMMIYFIYNTITNKKIQQEELNKIIERFNPFELIKIIETLVKQLPKLGYNIITALPTVISFVPKILDIGKFIFGLISSVIPFS